MPSVFLRGRIVDEHGDYVGDGLLVEEGRVARIGGARPGYARELRVEGAVSPPIVDAHLHVLGTGLRVWGVGLEGSRSPREVAERLRRRAAQGRVPLVYGRGWSEAEWTGAGPGERLDRRLLDSVSSSVPVVAVRVCGHMAVANTVALSLSGVHRDYPGLVDPGSGVVLEDAVQALVERLLERVDIGPIVMEGVRHIIEHGVAGVSSLQCTPAEARALAGLEAGGRLGLRVACYPEPGRVDAVARVLRGSRLVGLVGVKLFADGSLGARTARLSEPYADDPSNRGLLLLDSRGILERARWALSRGLRVAVHAIGDEALGHVLDAYESLGGGPMLRVEHASLVRPGVERRLAGLGVHVVVQPRFRVSDWWIPERLGPERARWAYRLASLERAGARLALSTDSPVEPVDPLETLRAATGRCGSPLCTPEESLDTGAALRAYTRGAASASGGSVSGLGRLEPGAPAVFTVWSGECCDSRPGLLRLEGEGLL